MSSLNRPSSPGVEDVIQLVTLLCPQQLGEELSPAAAHASEMPPMVCWTWDVSGSCRCTDRVLMPSALLLRRELEALWRSGWNWRR